MVNSLPTNQLLMHIFPDQAGDKLMLQFHACIKYNLYNVEMNILCVTLFPQVVLLSYANVIVKWGLSM